MQHGFFILFDLGILKSDERFKFHYATKKLIKEGDVVLDIGANLGYFSKLFARKNTKGTLYSIEPIPMFFNRLKIILSSYSHVKLIHAALGASHGNLHMIMPVQQGVMRTGLPHVISEEEAKLNPDHLTVPVQSARDFLANLPHLDYIKCDIEGYEWTVFSTLGVELERLRPLVQIEISERYITEFCEFFKGLNYVQCGLYDGKLIEEHGTQRVTSDFLFIPLEKKDKIFSTFNS
jgi:FkbM family methyltransferase